MKQTEVMVVLVRLMQKKEINMHIDGLFDVQKKLVVKQESFRCKEIVRKNLNQLIEIIEEQSSYDAILESAINIKQLIESQIALKDDCGKDGK